MFGLRKFSSFLNHPGYNAPVVAWVAANAGTIAAVTSVVSAVNQYSSSKDAAKAQKASIASQQAAQAAQEHRSRIQATREARIKRAMIASSAGQQGMGFSGSGVAGGMSSASSQHNENMAFSNQMQSFGTQASAANQRAVDAQSSAQMWQTIGGISQQVTPWNTLFGGGVNTQAPAPIEDRYA